jgi:hypothetical protein
VTTTSLTPASAWPDLVAVAVLGTDRRDPPPPLAGPVAEVILESSTARDVASAFVVQVGAQVVIERAAAAPSAAVALLVPADVDQRPPCSLRAASLLQRIVADWPILEPEWIALAESGGWRLSPELVPMLLRRHRARPDRRAAVCALAGPVADWLVGHLPELGPSSRRSGVTPPVDLPSDLQALLGRSPGEIAVAIGQGLQMGRYTVASGAVVVHLLARLPLEVLADLVVELEALDPHLPGRGLVHHLVDLAEVRLAVAHELAPLHHEETP